MILMIKLNVLYALITFIVLILGIIHTKIDSRFIKRKTMEAIVWFFMVSYFIFTLSTFISLAIIQPSM